MKQLFIAHQEPDRHITMTKTYTYCTEYNITKKSLSYVFEN